MNKLPTLKNFDKQAIEQGSKHVFSFQNPKKRLMAALDTLEAFTKMAACLSPSKVTFKKKKERALTKIFGLGKFFFAEAFSLETRKKKDKEQSQIKSNILKALDDVQRFHPIIFQSRSSESKELTKRALSIMKQYNEALEDRQQQSSSWHKHLLKFLVKKKDSSFNAPLQKAPHSKNISLISENRPYQFEKILSFLEQRQVVPTSRISGREEDAFRMKAISLIKNEEALFPSIREALNTIQKAPIYTISSSKEESQDVDTPSVITLEQTLAPFPGEIVILRGSFRRDPRSLTPSMPLPKSFEIKTESLQPGFPYPSQYNGWGLSDAFLPAFLLRPEESPHLANLLEKKELVAKSLLNRSSLLEKSRQLCKLKEKAALNNKSAFLFLQKELAKSIILSAPKDLTPPNSFQIIESFFSCKEMQDNPLQVIAKKTKEINTLFVENPCHSLKEAWVKGSEPTLYDQNPEARLKAAKKILLEAEEKVLSKAGSLWQDKSAKEYALLFGKLLTPSSANIFLQYFSETLESPPPQLLPFEKKLQAAALFQQETFISELKEELQSFPFSNLQKSLTSDIELFQNKGAQHPFCNTIEKYYLFRFVSID